MERYRKYLLSLISIIITLFVAKGEKTLYIFFPTTYNAEFRVIVNGYDKGTLSLPVKSTKSFDDWKTDFRSYEASVVPVVVGADGPVNVLVEMKYQDPSNGEITGFSSEQDFTIEEGGESFCEVKQSGFFGGVKIKDQDRKKGQKKLNSGKYSKLSTIKVSAAEKYEPDEASITKRREDKKVENENRKLIKKQKLSQLGKAFGTVVSGVSGIAESVSDTGHTGDNNDDGEDVSEIENPGERRLKQSERRELKKAYDKTIEAIQHYYKAISFGHETQKIEADNPDSQSRTNIKLIGDKNKEFLNKIFQLRKDASDIRRKAARGGYKIPRSKWEDPQPKELKVR